MRAFLALPLPDDVRDAAVRVQASLPVGRMVAPRNLHVTLAFLDDQPEESLEALHFELEPLRLRAFGMRFRGLDTFGGAKPRLIFAAVEPVPELLDLRQQIFRSAWRAGILLKAERYTPHVTLARLNGRPDATLARVLVDRTSVQFPGFTARTLTLFQSTLRPDGPVYEELASYPLT